MANKVVTRTILFLMFFSAAVLAKTRYDNFKLVRLDIQHDSEFELIGSLEKNNDFDLWNVEKVNYKYVTVVLSPEAYEKYSRLFDSVGISYKIVDNNIQDSLDKEEKDLEASKLSRANIINKFASYSEIISFIDETVEANKQIASSYITGGQTYGKRNLKVIVLKTSTSTKPVWIDCGIHAREWVSPATCVYVIETLVNNYKTNPASSILNTHEFHILPLLNPDGYELTRTDTRLWRKNLRINPNANCKGVDLNRNYDFQWLVNGGSSDDQCSDVYAGPSPNSEPETLGLISAINAKLGQWIAYFSIHSYGQYWLISFGHETTKPSDYSEMERVALIGTKAIEDATTDKTKFSAGQSSTMLYINSGSSQDWAKGKAGIKYSYTLELRPGQNTLDGFLYGFQLPENRLPKLTQETYAGIIAAINQIP